MWDIAAVDAFGQPQNIARCDSMHSSGIFSMHARSCTASDSPEDSARRCGEGMGGGGDRGVDILTASKDASVALTRLTGTGLAVVSQWHDVHSSVVKSVRWRDGSVFASAGNDRCGAAATIFFSGSN